MILIYLNYRLWSVKLKDIYGEVLDTLAFNSNLDVFDMYRLFLFLWMFEFIFWTRKFSYSYEFFNIRTKIQTKKGAIMIHDCIYQFLRLFYHSRFKPQQLEMTTTQFVAPVLDLVLVLPLILRLFKDFSRFSNATKMKIQSKPEINGQALVSFYDFLVINQRRSERPTISYLSSFFTHTSIFHQ